jgi:hypothetical protein
MPTGKFMGSVKPHGRDELLDLKKALVVRSIQYEEEPRNNMSPTLHRSSLLIELNFSLRAI